MSENDHLDTLSYNTILPNMKPVPDAFEYEVYPGKFETITFQKWALAYKKWTQVEENRCPRTYVPLGTDSHLVLFSTNTDPEQFFLVERENHFTECIVPGDVPLEFSHEGGTETVVPSMGDWSLLGSAAYQPIEVARFSDAAVAMCVAAGRAPFVPKHWTNIMQVSDLSEWADIYRRISTWKQVNRERIGSPTVTRDAGDADDAFGSFLNGL